MLHPDRENLASYLSTKETAYLAQVDQRRKSELMRNDGRLKVKRFSYYNYGHAHKLAAFIDNAALNHVEELRIVCGEDSTESATALQKLFTESRHDALTRLRHLDVTLDVRYLPPIDIDDIMRVLIEAPNLKVFILDTTLRPLSMTWNTNISTKRQRETFFTLMRGLVNQLDEVGFGVQFTPELTSEEALGLYTLLPHTCASLSSRCGFPGPGWRWGRHFTFRWGDDSARRIYTDLVPDFFDESWCKLTGQVIFMARMQNARWNDIDDQSKRYFNEWAAKCRDFDEMALEPSDLDFELFHAWQSSLWSPWIVKTMRCGKVVGVLFEQDRIVRVRWLPSDHSDGAEETISGLSFQERSRLIRDLQLSWPLVASKVQEKIDAPFSSAACMRPDLALGGFPTMAELQTNDATKDDGFDEAIHSSVVDAAERESSDLQKAKETSEQEAAHKEQADVVEAVMRSNVDAQRAAVLIVRLTSHSSHVKSHLINASVLEPLVDHVRSAGCEVTPSWANGALLLVPLAREMLDEAGFVLRAHNIVMLSDHIDLVKQVLFEMPKRKRPFLKPEYHAEQGKTHEALDACTPSDDTAGSADTSAKRCDRGSSCSPLNKCSQIISDESEIEIVVENTFLHFPLRAIELSESSTVANSAPADVGRDKKHANPRRWART